MNYHNILHDNMVNGEGLRVVLFVSGCKHHCFGCQNPQTWNCDSGVEFDSTAREEIFNELKKEHTQGITLTGGDPLHESNLECVHELIKDIRSKYPTKDIWLYTGELYNDTSLSYKAKEIMAMCDVVIDGRFEINLLSPNKKWVGSSNQRVINVAQSINHGRVITLE